MFVDSLLPLPPAKGTWCKHSRQCPCHGYLALGWVLHPASWSGVCVSACAGEAPSSAPSTPAPPPARPMATGITARLTGSRLTLWAHAKCTWSR